MPGAQAASVTATTMADASSRPTTRSERSKTIGNAPRRGVADERVGKSGLALEEKEAGLAKLRAAREGSAHRRDELLALVRWLEVRPRQVDPTALPTGRDAPETKGYVDLDDVVSRLLSRGDA